MAIDTFRLDVRRYPKDLSELMQSPCCEDAEKWNGPYLKDQRRLCDEWGRSIRYQAPGKVNASEYDLWSAGPDGVDGTADDIRNWSAGRR